MSNGDFAVTNEVTLGSASVHYTAASVDLYGFCLACRAPRRVKTTTDDTPTPAILGYRLEEMVCSVDESHESGTA